MKTVLLSADGDVSAYEVPDSVADNLSKYCSDFNDWLWSSPDAKKFHRERGVCYDETDFIDYLNAWVFPNEKSRLIEKIGSFDQVASEGKIPKKYKDCEWFNF